MLSIFSSVLSMSFAASILIIAVIITRLLMNRSPRWTVLVLWAFVGIRLLIPVTITSQYSLQPKIQQTEYKVFNADGTFDELTLPYQLPAPSIDSESNIDHSSASRIELPSFHNFLASIWLAGVFAMTLYIMVSYIKMYLITRNATNDNDIYVLDRTLSPFVFGIIKPKIYVPIGCKNDTLNYIITHERMHISRLDHIWKPLGFIILSIHWFNPLVWLAYALFCRDIELSCDEKVIKTMSSEDRVCYAQALLDCSTGKKYVSACPVAFGENSVKERIKAVLKYRKPAVWITAIAVILCVGVLFFFMTEQKDDTTTENDDITVETYKGSSFSTLPDKEKIENEIRYDFPGIHDTAIEYALDIGYGISVKHYKSGASFGHVAVLNLAETVKVKNDEIVELYYMEYYYYDGTISPDESSQKFIYPMFFALHQDLKTDKWTRLGQIYDYEMKNKYNTPEMTGKYGDELTAAAAELYREYFFLDMGEKEQMILSAYKAASEAAGWFRIASILEQEDEYPKENDTYIELDGIRYFKVKRFPEYQGFVDYLHGLFSKELVEEFLSSEHKRYINRDGELYATTGIRGTNIHMGDESYTVYNVSDSKYIVEVTVDIYGVDLVTVVDQEVFEFPYEFVDDRWVFTEFPKIR